MWLGRVDGIMWSCLWAVVYNFQIISGEGLKKKNILQSKVRGILPYYFERNTHRL